MINLGLLQERIDNLFDSESKESLTNWLFSKRYPEINKIVGEGEFVSLSVSNSFDDIEFIQELEGCVTYDAIQPISTLDFYKLAS